MNELIFIFAAIGAIASILLLSSIYNFSTKRKEIIRLLQVRYNYSKDVATELVTDTPGNRIYEYEPADLAELIHRHNNRP